jgi:SAM-dependent methyltransferase
MLRDAGWTIVGIEPYEHGRIAARRLGLSVRPGDAESLDVEPASFDWVRFDHVLEHTRDPYRALQNARRALVPGGRVIVAVPDCSGLPAWTCGQHWHGWQIPRHLFHFTRGTLRRLMVASGFVPMCIRSYLAPDAWINALMRRLRRKPCVALGLPPLGGPWIAAMDLQDEIVAWARTPGN